MFAWIDDLKELAALALLEAVVLLRLVFAGCRKGLGLTKHPKRLF
jgi:hypothetical protein